MFDWWKKTVNRVLGVARTNQGQDGSGALQKKIGEAPINLSSHFPFQTEKQPSLTGIG